MQRRAEGARELKKQRQNILAVKDEAKQQIGMQAELERLDIVHRS